VDEEVEVEYRVRAFDILVARSEIIPMFYLWRWGTVKGEKLCQKREGGEGRRDGFDARSYDYCTVSLNTRNHRVEYGHSLCNDFFSSGRGMAAPVTFKRPRLISLSAEFGPKK
jgi:hypothetical protein